MPIDSQVILEQKKKRIMKTDNHKTDNTQTKGTLRERGGMHVRNGLISVGDSTMCSLGKLPFYGVYF